MTLRKNVRTRDGRTASVASIEALERRELLSGDVTALNVGGALYLIGDAAANTIVVTNPSTGAFHVVGSGGTTVNGSASADVSDITGATLVLMGSGGGDSVTFHGATLPGLLEIVEGPGNNTFTLDQPSSVASFLSFAGSINDDTLRVTDTAIAGSVLIYGNGGADSATFATSSIGGDLYSYDAVGSNALSLTGTPVTGFLYNYTGFGTSATTLTNSNVGSYTYLYNVGGGDLGGGVATDTSVTGGTFGGAVTLINILGTDHVAFNPNSVAGAFYNDNGVGAATVGLTGTVTGLTTILGVDGANAIAVGSGARATLASDVVVVTGGGADVIAVRNLTVSGTTTLLAGEGNNTISVDESAFTGTLNIQTGSGADTVDLARLAGATGVSTFTGQVTVGLGAGGDALSLGRLGSTNAKGHYHTGLSADGGPGADSIDYVGHGNVFDTGAALVQTSFETSPQAPVVTASAGSAHSHGQAVVVDSGLTVTDADSANLVGGTVSVTSGYHSGTSHETLDFTDQNGITGSWDDATGVLTLTGTATVAQYQAALRSITWSGTNPAEVTRTVTFIVSDDIDPSVAATRTVAVDTTVPTVSVAVAEGQANPTNGSPIHFTVTFSESVTGFASDDLDLGGTASGTLSAVVTGSGATYDVAVSGMTGSGTVTLGVKAGAALDIAANPNTVSPSSASAIYDVTAPTVGVAVAVAQANPTHGSPINFTVTFSESVTGFTSADLTLGGTAPGTLSALVTGSGATYNVAVSGMTGSGTVTLGVKASAATDAAGNSSEASPSDASVSYDNVAPTVTVSAADGQADPTKDSPLNFTVTFSESVTGFDGTGVSLSGTAPGTLSAVVTGSGTTYNVAVSGMTGSGTVIVSLFAGAGEDAAGNDSLASSGSATVNYDVTAPTVSVAVAAGQDNPTNESPINFTVTFSESVTGFTSDDLTFGGTAPGTKAAVVTGSGATYNVEVSGMTGSGTVTLGIKASAAQDAAGNNSTVSPSSASVTYDVTAPTVGVAVATGQANPTNGSPVNFRVTFSESVTGFDETGVSLSGTAGATTAVVTGSGTTYNVAVSGMTGPGTVIVSIFPGAAQDAAGNLSLASSGSASVSYDPGWVDFSQMGDVTWGLQYWLYPNGYVFEGVRFQYATGVYNTDPVAQIDRTGVSGNSGYTLTITFPEMKNTVDLTFTLTGVTGPIEDAVVMNVSNGDSVTVAGTYNAGAHTITGTIHYTGADLYAIFPAFSAEAEGFTLTYLSAN